MAHRNIVRHWSRPWQRGRCKPADQQCFVKMKNDGSDPAVVFVCAAPIASALFLGVKFQRRAIDAIAQAGRLRPVLENMAQMATAIVAMNLGPYHEMAAIGGGCDGFLLGRCPEAWPAAATVIFGVRCEQHLAAAGAGI